MLFRSELGLARALEVVLLEKKAVVEARNEADSLMYQTEKTLTEHKEKVPQEDADAIRADISALKDASANTDISSEALKEKVKEAPAPAAPAAPAEKGTEKMGFGTAVAAGLLTGALAIGVLMLAGVPLSAAAWAAARPPPTAAACEQAS